MSAREQITKDIIEQLQTMSNPAVGLVSRETFDFEKLAITQFPAIQIWAASEERSDVSMSERQGTLQIQLRCYLRGNEMDTKRNNLIENIEQVLETNRNRNITVNKQATHYVNAQLTSVEVIERQPPLGEMVLTYQVEYVYQRGNV
jgi:hypothetical protein|tara:strand:- start:9849 stop:10286 length:438 start_codon:yes stop_codon:yes gene_type:complete